MNILRALWGREYWQRSAFSESPTHLRSSAGGVDLLAPTQGAGTIMLGLVSRGGAPACLPRAGTPVRLQRTNMDDFPKNVAAGAARGWQTLLHVSPAQTIPQVERLLLQERV